VTVCAGNVRAVCYIMLPKDKLVEKLNLPRRHICLQKARIGHCECSKLLRPDVLGARSVDVLGLLVLFSYYKMFHLATILIKLAF
jgi:hypothetical protein